MRRRKFITLLRGRGGSVAVRCSRAAAGGAGDRFLHSASPNGFADRVSAFRQGLMEFG
jgi:hypothetical protein